MFKKEKVSVKKFPSNLQYFHSVEISINLDTGKTLQHAKKWCLILNIDINRFQEQLTISIDLLSKHNIIVIYFIICIS